MPPPDDKQYPLASKLVTPRARRSTSPHDYTLPKPYRRTRFADDAPELGRLRIALLIFSGLVIASLVAALAMLAKENLDPQPVVIIPAPKMPQVALTAPAAAAAVAAPSTPPAKAGPAASALARVEVPPKPKAAAQVRNDPPRSAPLAVTLAAKAKVVRIPQKTPKPEPVVAPDPDVVLITTILALTPRPVQNPAPALCSPGALSDAGCAAIHGMKP